ncbi:hypothetical protein AB0A95_33900 [Micromonospora sp. NPDC049230]|uniref:hypothetical protein n=1 Tax=Micromonospora sp. NPDC049230 TaxID=3155502 RepID=UPI0033FD5C4A
MNGAELAARVAALPAPEVFLDRIQRRERARAGFLDRVGRWVAEQGGLMRLPADRAVVIAFGVPCENCDLVVTEDGQGGHRVEFGASAGELLGASIVTRCGPRAGASQ